MEIQVRLQRRKKAAVHKQEQEYGAAVALDIAVEAGMPDMVPDTAAVAVAVMVVWIVAVMAVDTQSDVAGREMSRYSSEQLFLAMIAYSCHQKLIILHMRISANNQDQTMPPPHSYQSTMPFRQTSTSPCSVSLLAHHAVVFSSCNRPPDPSHE